VVGDAWDLQRRESEMQGPRWRWTRWWWLPPWRDALLMFALAAVTALGWGFWVVAHTPPPPPPAIDITDPFSQRVLHCSLVPDPIRYDCTQESP